MPTPTSQDETKAAEVNQANQFGVTALGVLFHDSGLHKGRVDVFKGN